MKFFKQLRHARKLGKAQGLVMNNRYAEAKVLLNELFESSPPEYMVILLHSIMGEVEYNLSNYDNAMKHLEICIKDSVENPETWKDESLMEILERVHWFYKNSEVKHNKRH
jgi:hypothetical protein